MIGVCGYGFTGSGAVLDLLKEYDSLNVIDGMEFSLPYSPDGLLALRANLLDYCARSASGIVAIRRFEKLVKSYNSPNSSWRKLTKNHFIEYSKKYIDSLTQASWKGKLGYDITQYSWLMQRVRGSFLGRLQRVSDKILKRYIPIVSDKEMKLSILPESFDAKTKEYLKEIIRCFSEGDKEIVLDQPFPANRPDLVFDFFECPRAIIVDRDPRDVYVLAKKVVLSQARFMPCENVDEFIKYYKSIRESIEYGKDESRILRINFEDLIYEYDITVKKIEGFLGISATTRKERRFNPAKSVVNTRLFEKYEDARLADDIRKIEECLSEWLYRFESHVEVEAESNVKPF